MYAKPPQAAEGPLLLVELFALPGAGKTTVVAAAAERSNVTTRKDLSACWARNSALQRAVHVGRAFAGFGAFAAAIRFAFGARIATAESIFRLMRLVAKRDWLESQSGVVLLDQGFLQDLWSILVAGYSNFADPKLLSPLIRALYKGIDAKIVLIDVDPLTAAARIQSRTSGHSRFDGLHEAELRMSLMSVSELQCQIIAAAKLAGLAVHTIDGCVEPDVLTEKLHSLLSPEKSARSPARSKQHPRRISIVGSTGSGKSYLAGQLADLLGLPVHELDELRRSEIGLELSRESFQQRVAELVCGDAWIVDGHYRDVRHQIWSRAHVVIWLNYPLTVVGKRLVGRYRRKRQSANSALANAECRHTRNARSHQAVSWSKRLKRLVRTLRERREYGRVLCSSEYPDLQIVELRSIRKTELWLRSLSTGERHLPSPANSHDTP